MHEIINHDALADVKRADPLGRVDFMARKGKHVNVLLLDIDRHIADGLHRIGVEQNAFIAADFPDFRNRLDGADFVVRVHDGDQRRIRPNGLFNLLRRNQTHAVDREIGHLKAVFFQVFAGVKHCVMLKVAGDDMFLSLGRELHSRAFDGPVVALRPAGGEVDLAGLRTECRGNLAPSLFNGPLGRPGNAVNTAGVPVMLGQVWHHRIQNALRNPGGSGVVRVNKTFLHISHSFLDE